MSAFGALPLSAKNLSFDAVAASSNKCLEGVPGVGFVLVKKTIIEKAKGNCHSLSLDLFDQWQSMEKKCPVAFHTSNSCFGSILSSIKRAPC